MRFLTLAGVGLTVALAGCATTPLRNAELDRAHEEVRILESQPNAAEIAGKPLQDARDALARADAAAAARRSPEYVTHWAYIAHREAEVGEAVVAEARARALVDQAEARRNRVLLEARERDVRAAQAQTYQAQASAAAAQADATAARMSEERARDMAAQQGLQAQADAAAAAAAQADAAAAREAQEAARRELRDLQAKETDRGLVITLSNVLFDTATATLKPGANLALDHLARFMQKSPGTTLLIEGHADSRGSDEYNEELSRRRAQSVADALESRAIRADRVQVVGRGKRYPVASNDTPEGRQQNRRVEIVFSDNQGRFARSAER